MTTRADDERARDRIARIDDAPSRACVEAERAFMRRLGAGCHAPAGAHARIVESATIHLAAAVFASDGTTQVRSEARGTMGEADDIGTRAAARIIDKGGRSLLDDRRSRAEARGEDART